MRVLSEGGGAGAAGMVPAMTKNKKRRHRPYGVMCFISFTSRKDRYRYRCFVQGVGTGLLFYS